MRVVLHAHEGMRELGDNVARLLGHVPELTIVDTVLEPGYTCGGSGADRSPALKAHLREQTVRRACDPDVDALVSLYHGCHMQLAAAARQHGFETVNFTDLLVQGLGGEPRTDALEAFRALSDWQKIAHEAQPMLAANGIQMSEEALADILPDLFTSGEFKGGLEVFAPKS